MALGVSIGKAGGENIFKSSGSDGSGEVWNIADGFTKINVLKILIEINLFEIMAKFGKQDMETEVDYRDVPLKRVEGFDRMLFALRQVISNCMFQIERDDKMKIVKLRERLDLVENVADGIASEFINDVTKESEIRINEKHFALCFDTLSNIKEELNFLLNKAGLIFRKSDITDIDDFMKTIYDG